MFFWHTYWSHGHYEYRASGQPKMSNVLDNLQLQGTSCGRHCVYIKWLCWSLGQNNGTYWKTFVFSTQDNCRDSMLSTVNKCLWFVLSTVDNWRETNALWSCLQLNIHSIVHRRAQWHHLTQKLWHRHHNGMGFNAYVYLHRSNIVPLLTMQG